MLEEFLSMPAGHAAIYDRQWRQRDLCPYLRFQAKEMPQSEWLVDGEQHKGAHMTQIGWTKNADHRSLEKNIERDNRAGRQLLGLAERWWRTSQDRTWTSINALNLELAERPSSSNARYPTSQDPTWRGINALNLATPSLKELGGT